MVVRCPECGQQCDRVNELAISRRSWSFTPTYERLMRPAMCFIMLLIVLPILWGFLQIVDEVHARISMTTLCAVTAVLVVTWIVLLIRNSLVLPSYAGLGYVLLAHVVVVGYLLLSFSIVAGALCIVIIGLNPTISQFLILGLPLRPAIIIGLLLVSAIFIYFVLRLLFRLDAHIGRHCLRHEAQLHLPHAVKNEHGIEHP